MGKRVLFISGIRLFPAELGGHIRPAVFCQALAELGYEVSVYSFTGRRDDYVQKRSSYFHSPFSQVTEYVDTSKSHFVLHQMFKFLGLPPIWPLMLTRLGYCPRRLKEMILGSDFIISEYIFTMMARRRLSQTSWFMDSHNVEHKREADQGGYHKLIAKVLAFIEKKVPVHYDGVFACTEEEVEFFRACVKPDKKCQIVHIPNGIVAADYYSGNFEEKKNLRIQRGFSDHDTVLLFCGSSYYANRDAVSFLRSFARDHAAWMSENKVYFLVVGGVEKNPAKEGQYIATSFVKDPKQYYKMADYMINPMMLGSGSNIKVAEAIAANLPILSTDFGMRGFDVVSNIDYLSFERRTLLEVLKGVLASDKEIYRERSESVRNRILESIDGLLICQKRMAPLI